MKVNYQLTLLENDIIIDEYIYDVLTDLTNVFANYSKDNIKVIDKSLISIFTIFEKLRKLHLKTLSSELINQALLNYLDAFEKICYNEQFFDDVSINEAIRNVSDMDQVKLQIKSNVRILGQIMESLILNTKSNDGNDIQLRQECYEIGSKIQEKKYCYNSEVIVQSDSTQYNNVYVNLYENLCTGNVLTRMFMDLSQNVDSDSDEKVDSQELIMNKNRIFDLKTSCLKFMNSIMMREEQMNSILSTGVLSSLIDNQKIFDDDPAQQKYLVELVKLVGHTNTYKLSKTAGSQKSDLKTHQNYFKSEVYQIDKSILNKFQKGFQKNFKQKDHVNYVIINQLKLQIDKFVS